MELILQQVYSIIILVAVKIMKIIVLWLYVNINKWINDSYSTVPSKISSHVEDPETHPNSYAPNPQPQTQQPLLRPLRRCVVIRFITFTNES